MKFKVGDFYQNLWGKICRVVDVLELHEFSTVTVESMRPPGFDRIVYDLETAEQELDTPLPEQLEILDQQLKARQQYFSSAREDLNKWRKKAGV